MKPQDTYKLLAAFMILIMIILPITYIVTSPSVSTNQQTTESEDKYNPEFWVVNHPFFSISDALNITPPGAISAKYADLEAMTPQMIQWVRTQLPVNEVDSLYKSETTKLYYAILQDEERNNLLVLSTMFPEKNDFEYMVLPNTYPPILRRLDTGYNIMGTPVIYTPYINTAVEVLEIIYSLNKTNTSYDQYKGLLSKIQPAPFQMIDSNVSFAEQFYMGIGMNNDSYERTTAYLNINYSTLKKLEQLKANSMERGFTLYNITQEGNYTIVRISGSFLSVVMEELS